MDQPRQANAAHARQRAEHRLRKLVTLLPAADQAALHGILARIGELGLELVEVRRLPVDASKLASVAYDEQLADRIRLLIGSNPDLTEKKMFGGLAFLIGGNMAIAASSQGGAMVRVDPEESAALVATTEASLVEMRGREMPGWLLVSSDDLRSDDQLRPWVDRCLGYARSLPPKR